MIYRFIRYSKPQASILESHYPAPNPFRPYFRILPNPDVLEYMKFGKNKLSSTVYNNLITFTSFSSFGATINYCVVENEEREAGESSRTNCSSPSDNRIGKSHGLMNKTCTTPFIAALLSLRWSGQSTEKRKKRLPERRD